METGIGVIDKIIARWSYGDWTPTSLYRTGLFWALFWLIIAVPGLRLKVRHWCRLNPWKSAGLTALLIFGFVFCSMWPLNDVEWALVDDHEILIELNDREKFTAADLFEKVAHHVELGGCFAREKNLARFRPAYYFLRYAEVWLWQGNPHAWGRARIFLAGFSLWVFFLAVRRLSDPLLAGMIALAVATFPCWPDTWRYLGRAEIYAAVGMALNLYGFALLWGTPPRLPNLSVWAKRSGWGLMLLGFIIAFGSKENFIILLGPIGLVYLRNLWNRWPIGLCGHLAIAVSLGIVVGMAVVLKYKLSLSEGLDIYGRSTESSQRLSLFLPAAKAYFLSGQGIVLLAISGVYLLLGFRNRNRSSPGMFRSILLEIGTALGISSAVFISQYVFYVGALDNRYRFPAEFTWYLAAVGLACCMTRTARLRQFGLIAWRLSAWRTLFLLAALPVLNLGPHRLTNEIIIRVEQTKRFEQFLSQVAKVCRDDPSRPVVIEATQVFVYEPSYAMPILLKHFGVANPLYHRYAPKPDLISTESPHMYRWLVGELTEISRDGKFGYRPWPKDHEAELGRPFVIAMDADEPITSGEWLGRAPW
ncbi:MAG: hypothetical protein KDA36_00905 [Planctomycetaceae bacterium]|nr:hypothetical protein [Planctomycetaceae bacterium]